MSEINNKNMQLAQQLANKDYSISISEDTLSNGQIVYLLEHPELPGCMAHGNTFDAALRELHEVTVEYIYYMLEDRLNVPEPLGSQPLTTLDSGHNDFKITKGWQMIGTDVTEDEIENALTGAIQPESRHKSMQFTVIMK